MYGIVRLSSSRCPEERGPVRNLLRAFILYHKKPPMRTWGLNVYIVLGIMILSQYR